MSKVVSVVFDNYSKSYDYNVDFEACVGDYVVVDSPMNGYVVVEVKSVKAISAAATEWVVCKVDDSEYKARIAKAKRAVEIKALLDKKLKEMEDVLKYEMLAKDDFAASLIKELKTL